MDLTTVYTSMIKRAAGPMPAPPAAPAGQAPTLPPPITAPGAVPPDQPVTQSQLNPNEQAEDPEAFEQKNVKDTIALVNKVVDKVIPDQQVAQQEQTPTADAYGSAIKGALGIG